MDYTNPHESRYIVTGPESMLGHPYHNGAFVSSEKNGQTHNQFALDNCVLLPSARHDYQPFDYTMINQHYPMADQVHDQTIGVSAVQQHYTEALHAHGKTVPHDQW